MRTCASNSSRQTLSGGKQTTSMRLNAMCEVRCVIDLSGPQSLFSISIYRHLSSLNHTSVSPLCRSTAPSCPFPTHTTTDRHWCQSTPKPTQDDSLSSKRKLREALFIGVLLFSRSERSRSWNDADNLPANHKSMQLQIWRA